MGGTIRQSNRTTQAGLQGSKVWPAGEGTPYLLAWAEALRLRPRAPPAGRRHRPQGGQAAVV